MPPKRDPPVLEETLAAMNIQLNENSSRTQAALEALPITIATAIAESMSQIQSNIAQFLQNSPPHKHTTSPYVEHPSSSSINQEPPPLHQHRPPDPYPGPPTIKPPRIQLASFDGTQPLDWIFQANQFFHLHQVPEPERLTWVSFYMQGDALSWYKHLHENHLIRDWRSFLRDMEIRFGPSSYENHQATLFKLRQKGTVAEYQTEFERLANCVAGLSLEALKNCFISGLRGDVQRELAILRPHTLIDAMGQARLVEAKVGDVKSRPPPFQPRQNSSPFIRNYSPSPMITTPPPFTPGARPLPLPAPPIRPTTIPQFKRLTPEELRYKRENGLCFGCPEKFHSGHKCKQQHHHFLLLAPSVSYPQEEIFEDALEEEQPHIGLDIEPDSSPTKLVPQASLETTQTGSLYHLSTAACFGSSSPRTLRVEGRIYGKAVSVLVDSGSTHNIVQPRIAEFLHLPIQPREKLSVMVGNGERLHCIGECHEIPLTLAEHVFTLPLLVLPIQGADIVLGVAWLRTLGIIQADFAIPTMSFRHEGQHITLSGEPTLLPSTGRQLRRLMQTEAVASVHAVWHEELQSETTDTGAAQESPKQLSSLLEQYKDLFQPPTSLPPSRPHDHHINLQPNTPPVNIKPYRYPHYQKEVMTQLIAEMLRDGIIRPSTSPYSSPVLLVRKKDGTWRFCVDYRGLNAITVRDRFPIPTVDELLDELHGAVVFSKIDLRSGYHQLRVAPEDIHKTAFRTVDGHYEFLVMPFGLTNAPSTFQAAMNDLFRPFLRRFVLVFFDDILVYSTSMEEHHVHLSQVFHTLAAHTYYAKLSKCVFGVAHVNYLGHIISASGVSADPDKLNAITSWPAPTSFTTLRGFLGLTGYYRRFVHHYAKITGPITDILKLPKFVWTPEAQESFQTLKDRMTSLPILALPNFTLPFEVTTDASGCAIGAVLSQKDHPIAYFSKKLSNRMQAAGAYTRELFAVTQAVQKWRQYLLGQKFIIYTDQQSLKHLLTQSIQTPDQERWLTRLMGYQYEIKYKPGCENKVADALSRVVIPSCLAISAPTPNWLDTLRQFFTTNPIGQQLLKSHTHQDAEADPKLAVHNGLLYYNQRLFIPLESGLRPSLIQEYHNSTLGGHSGIKATVVRLASSFYWKHLVSDVKDYIQACLLCQQTKSLPQKPYGLLQPLPIPNQVWEDLSMDFITSLPPSQGKSAIWVIVDRLSKFAHFIPLPPSYSATTLAQIFLTDIYKLHGLPRTIVSDRDPIFLSKFWRELFRLLGTTLQFSSAYHPQTDGQTEVVNRCLEAYLRCFVCDEPQRWTRFLPLAEYWYNTNYHSALKMTPFQALYGRLPPTATTALPGSDTVPAIATIMSERSEMLTALKQNLIAAQQRMTSQANKHRLDKQFSPGDRVLLKLRPYRQTTVRRRSCPKLSRRYYGPFTILRRIGQVAYELELPEDAQIHRVFHVSLLRPCHGDISVSPTPLPAMDSSGRPVLRPTNFLDQRFIQRSGDLVPQVLVQWENTPLEEATWEDFNDFIPESTHQTPSLSELADKFPVIGEGIDAAERYTEVGNNIADLGAKPRTRKQPVWMKDFLLSLGD